MGNGKRANGWASGGREWKWNASKWHCSRKHVSGRCENANTLFSLVFFSPIRLSIRQWWMHIRRTTFVQKTWIAVLTTQLPPRRPVRVSVFHHYYRVCGRNIPAVHSVHGLQFCTRVMCSTSNVISAFYFFLLLVRMRIQRLSWARWRIFGIFRGRRRHRFG